MWNRVLLSACLSVLLLMPNISVLKLCLDQEEVIHSEYQGGLWHKESRHLPKPVLSSADSSALKLSTFEEAAHV